MDRAAGDSAVWTPLGVWAAQMHETYQSLTQAGFTECQALTLIVGMLHASPEEP